MNNELINVFQLIKPQLKIRLKPNILIKCLINQKNGDQKNFDAYIQWNLTQLTQIDHIALKIEKTQFIFFNEKKNFKFLN